MENKKVSTVAGLGVLIILSLTTVYFIWIVEKNQEQPVSVSQVVIAKKVVKTTESKSATTEEDKEPSRPTNLCKGLSEEPGIGEHYPVAEKYSHLSFLGELFTASDCGSQRVLEVNHGNDERKNGITLFLNTAPSDEFRATLESIGFSCEEGLATSCVEWNFKEPIKLEKLLRLRPFVDEIDVDDCIICG